MDHSGHGMVASTTATVMSGMSDMSGMTQTATGTAAMASNTGMSMGGGGMNMGGGCKISMLWNWYTVDSCFVSRSWHITSNGMFAGSCIGVILLVILLEALRRAGKEYDRYIVNQYLASHATVAAAASSASSDDDSRKNPATTAAIAPTAQSFRPSVIQQAIRALLHMLQFAVAYFVMLLAMYYNGYIIICIFIGAYLGYFICGWESFTVGRGGSDRMQENATVCCG
ncbi:Copper Transporter integral membrane protein that functions in high affinity copper transport [Ascochyta rabiei]|uniref:Copper transport protein n=1 Tax=Didymella rabiei TaxID=5454 RepID=A0A163E3B9_DIDRA|nr:Copper Transporter integral membrane protein that functions in high affinity copper transport [Ascochyta rabiei]KZM23494.1 copper ion transmembrane transporter [Ascochyta rabiei]UPX09566.1 Copper Transporter integral membrane protein that functions in high affinity copper transport [Ascochyta rabiei]